MNNRFSVLFILVITMGTTSISMAGFFESLEKIQKSSADLIDNVSEDMGKVGDMIKESIPIADNNDPPPEQSQRNKIPPRETVVIAYNNDEGGAEVSGVVNRNSIIAHVNSIITNNESRVVFGVYLYLTNIDVSSVIGCKTFIWDKFGNELFDSSLTKQRKKYTEFLQEKVLLSNVRVTKLKENCLFSNLKVINDSKFIKRNAIGVVKKQLLNLPFHVAGIMHPVSFGLNNAIYTGGNALNCTHFYQNKGTSQSELRQVSAKVYSGDNIKAKISNVRYSNFKGQCLFDDYELID